MGTRSNAAVQRRVILAFRITQVLGGVGQAVDGSAGALLTRDITGSDPQAGWPQASTSAGVGAAPERAAPTEDQLPRLKA